MTYIELENGNYVNIDAIERILRTNYQGTVWKIAMKRGEDIEITDSDRKRILDAAQVIRVEQEKAKRVVW